MSTIEVKVPDIGDFKDVPVIEVFVKPGDNVKPDDSLITLESDKAMMDVPSPSAGVVKDLKLKVGDKVSEGGAILTLETDGAAAAPPPQQASAKPSSPSPSPSAAPAQPPAAGKAPPPPEPSPASGRAGVQEVKVPDIGDFKNVPVIEVFVKPGDTVKADDPLVTLESDKATMDVPAPAAGVIKDLTLKVGDKVSEGTVILTLEARQTAAAKAPQEAAAPAATKEEPSTPRTPPTEAT